MLGFVVFVCAFVLSFSLNAQSRSDFDKLSELILNQSVTVTWSPDSRYIYYQTDRIEEGEEVKCYWLADVKKADKILLFTSRNLPSLVNPLLDEKTEHCSFYDVNLSKLSKGIFYFRFRDNVYAYNFRTSRLTKSDFDWDNGRKNFGPRKNWTYNYSPDSSFFVTAFDHDLYLGKSVSPDSLIKVSSDGEQFHSYSLSGNSYNPKSGNNSPRGLWINDSSYLVVRENIKNVRELSLVNSLAKNGPEVKTYKFAMPGDTVVPSFDVNVLKVNEKGVRMIPVDLNCFKDQKINLPRFGSVKHTDRYAYFIRTARTCDTLDLVRLDLKDCSSKVLIRECSECHYNEQLFSYHIINDGKEILWWSDRDGNGKFYLYDGEGNLKNVIGNGDYVAGAMHTIDTASRTVIFEAYGFDSTINPHYRQYCRASMDSDSAPVLLTPGNGHHDISVSPAKNCITDTYSRMDQAPIHQVCDMKGKVLLEIERADVSRLFDAGWEYPEVISLKAVDGKTDLYGVVYKPLDAFVENKSESYPIISSVYPGPQTDLVPQSFYFDDNYNQSLAQCGAIVINFSYRGSGPYRGYDFYTFGYGNLRDYALDDDFAVISQVAEMYGADINKVGIYGHSGGAFMTVAAMLTRPEVYKVGVASSGNHDNNIYSQWWGETFHGVKWDSEKKRFVSEIPTNISLAANLQGKLLLVTGDMDNNVHPASTLRMANALIRQNKYFDMMILPGADHGLGDKYYTDLIKRYFVENLISGQ